LIRAYLEGAETGMRDIRGYGLSASELEEAERLARYFYLEPETVGAAS
jgi:hypothetical protein